jgi:membrane associated rhomboid family serine protease
MIPLWDDNPTHRTPFVTIGIILACVLIYAWQHSLGPAGGFAIYGYSFIPAVLFGEAQLPPEVKVLPAWATMFSAMFLHGNLAHLGGNMLYLWIFGNNIEDVMGHGRFALFYLLCGLAAAFAQALPDPASEIPMIGASGAISGVLGAYILLFPHARVRVLILIFLRTIPAWLLLGIWIFFQLSSGIGADLAEGGVAWWAHVGGFAAGMTLVHFFRDRNHPALARQRGGRTTLNEVKRPAPPARAETVAGRSRIPVAGGRPETAGPRPEPPQSADQTPPKPATVERRKPGFWG